MSGSELESDNYPDAPYELDSDMSDEIEDQSFFDSEFVSLKKMKDWMSKKRNSASSTPTGVPNNSIRTSRSLFDGRKSAAQVCFELSSPARSVSRKKSPARSSVQRNYSKQCPKEQISCP